MPEATQPAPPVQTGETPSLVVATRPNPVPRAATWLWWAACAVVFALGWVTHADWPVHFGVVQGAPSLSGDGRLRIHVRGRVQVDAPEPTPLSGALVRVYSERADGSIAPVKDGTTAADGTLLLDQLPGGTLWVLVEAAGHNRLSRSVQLFGERSLEFALGPAKSLEIRVLDDEQHPLQGATVLVQDSDALPFGALSDADGRVKLQQLGPPPYRLSVFAKGYESYERVGVTKDQSVILRRLGGLSVHVTAGGQSAAGAEVHIVGSNFWPGRRLEADADGRVHLGGLLAGVYDVRARKGELISQLSASIPLERGERKDVELELVQGRFIRVACNSERPDSLPVAGASIVVSELGLSPFPVSAVSDADGKARVGPLSYAPAFVSVSAEGYVGRNAVPVPEDTDELKVVLLHGATIEGRVVDSHGHSIIGASVEIIGFDLDGLPINESPELAGFRKAHFTFALTPPPLIPAGELGVTRGHLPYVSEVGNAGNWGDEAERRPAWISDIEGRFTAYPVPPGRVRALVRHPGFVEGLSETFELAPAQVQSVTVILQDGGHLLGRVVDERGFPIGGVRIQVTAPNASYERNLLTNDAGAFELAATPREVNVALARPMDPSRFVLQELVQVPSGSDTEHEFVLSDPRETLHWVVHDEDDQPLELAQVSLASLDPKVPLRVTRFSDSDGRVGIDDAAGLDVQVTVQAPGYVAHNERLREAPIERSFKLHKGTRVTGEITAVRGHVQVMGAEVVLETAERRLSTLTDGGGHFDFSDVARGRALLTVRHADYGPARLEIEVVDTGRVDRALELPPIDLQEGCSAEGVVVDSEGEAVAGARVALGTPAGHLARNAGGGASTTTDEDGHFVLKGLPSGELTLGALAPTRERGSLRITLEPGQELQGLTLQLGDEPELVEIGSQSGGVAADFGETEVEGATRVVLQSVQPGSEAERAGLRAGDVITDVDGASVSSAGQARARTTGRAGQDVIVGVERSGEHRAYRVRLETLRH